MAPMDVPPSGHTDYPSLATGRHTAGAPEPVAQLTPTLAPAARSRHRPWRHHGTRAVPVFPIVSRPPLSFPGGARLAFYVGLNIERFRPDLPIEAGSGPVPDPLAYGWRDYGNHVGVWR